MLFEGIFVFGFIFGVLLIAKAFFKKRVARVVTDEEKQENRGKAREKNKAVTARYDKILMNIEIYDGTENGQNKF